MTEPTKIDIAAYALQQAKQSEDEAREARIAAEQHLIDLVGLKEEGTTTVKTDFYKVSTTGKLTRAVDPKSPMSNEVWKMISRVKSELDVKALKALATSNPAAYQEACKGLITKPAKASAKVELLQQNQEAA